MAPRPTTPEIDALLACRICLNEIPSSVADTLEGRDYVHYFCGADCYALWQNQACDNSAQPQVAVQAA
jgi:hypothetical protein